jgi:hypothetical protein
MLPVLPWYHHNIVLTVFGLSGIITVQILTIFSKSSMFNTSIDKVLAGIMIAKLGIDLVLLI